MATPQENEAQARTAYAAFAAGDLETVKGVLHPDIVWRVAGGSSLAGDYKGVDEVLGFFARMFTDTNGTFSTTLIDVIADGKAAVAISRVRAERGGKTIDMEQVAIYRLDADGKVTEATFYSDDHTQFDAFFA